MNNNYIASSARREDLERRKAGILELIDSRGKKEGEKKQRCQLSSSLKHITEREMPAIKKSLWRGARVKTVRDEEEKTGCRGCLPRDIVPREVKTLQNR